MREHADIVKILIAKRSNVNARDIIGRTPLFHAAKLNNVQIVKLLLTARANPLIMTGNGKGPNNITKNPEILKYLTKATLLVICLPMIKQPWVRQQVWEDEGLRFFQKEDDEETPR